LIENALLCAFTSLKNTDFESISSLKLMGHF